MKDSDTEIFNSLFMNNKAHIGGAIRYLNFIPKFVKN